MFFPGLLRSHTYEWNRRVCGPPCYEFNLFIWYCLRCGQKRFHFSKHLLSSLNIVVAGFVCCAGRQLVVCQFCFSLMPQYGHQKASYPKSSRGNICQRFFTSPRAPTQRWNFCSPQTVLLSSSALWPALTLHFLSLLLPRAKCLVHVVVYNVV